MAFIPYANPTKAAATVPLFSQTAPVATSMATGLASSLPGGNVLGDSTGQAPATTPVASHPLNQAAIDNTNKSLAELPGILQHALAANNQTYQNAQQSFDAQQQQQQQQYDHGTMTNQQNYDANEMGALRAGANGLSGLLSILRGTGAEGWARNVVHDTTSGDIQDGLNTRNQNQTSLDNSLSGFLADLADKRHANDVTHQGNEFAARESNATGLQDLYAKLAGYYSDAGDNANATKYLNMAGDLAPDIARYGVAPVGKYDTSPVTVHAADISAFAAPTKQSVTYKSGNDGTGAGIFTVADARKRLQGA